MSGHESHQTNANQVKSQPHTHTHTYPYVNICAKKYMKNWLETTSRRFELSCRAIIMMMIMLGAEVPTSQYQGQLQIEWFSYRLILIENKSGAVSLWL